VPANLSKAASQPLYPCAAKKIRAQKEYFAGNYSGNGKKMAGRAAFREEGCGG
jgi:hypothetical protein